MPRIPDDDIERVKRDTDLLALIRSRGIELRQHGAKDWVGKCPFHADHDSPNFIVSPAKGLYHCMACGAAGNPIQFVEKFDGVSFRHAFELLAGRADAAYTAGSGKPLKRSTAPKLPCPIDAQTTARDSAKTLAQVADYYAQRLTQNPAAQAYLATRGLDDESLIARFNIGFSDRTLGLRIPHARRKDGAQLREKLKALGVYRPNGREHLNGCLTVPVTDAKGETVQLYGRRIDPKAPKENRHLYLARPLAGIFNPQALKTPAGATGREIILTESILDALTFYRHGMEAVTCTFGTANFSEELFEAIRSAKIESVKLAFDADAAGETARAKAAARLQASGIECHQVSFPWGTDANQYANEQGGEALRQAVRNATWIEPSTAPKPSSKSPSTPKAASSPKAIKASHDTMPDLAPAPSSLAANLAAKEKTPTQPPTPELTQTGDYHQVTLGPASGPHSRHYRIGGLEKNNSLEVLRITLRIHCDGLLHVDVLDLYRDADRRKFIDRAAEETRLEKDLLKRDLGKLLLLLEQSQEQRLTKPADDTTGEVELTPRERAAALELLRSPDLLERITANYTAAGVVGEQTNLLAAYLAATSRKLAKPLAIIIQSTSAAGKSTLMDTVLSFFPDEEQVKYSAMTGQSLYYLGETNLRHKILAIVEEEGAEKASYALKLLQSEGELTIASTGKDPNSGRMETQEYHVEGPVMIILTTTAIDIDEELMNRCIVLTVDESTAQTELIHALQREARTPEGILQNEKRQDIQRLMQNAQRLITPMRIANPFARHLTFTSGRTRTRRDHEKYLTLIDTIALLHQHQRKTIKHPINRPADDRRGEQRTIEMLPVTLEDIEAANRIAPEVLGRSLDELPPQTRRLLESIKQLIRSKMKAEQSDQRTTHFSRRELRDFTGWSQMQIRRHLDRLHELEYITTRGGRNGITLRYELLTDAHQAADSYHIGLIDVAQLRRKRA